MAIPISISCFLILLVCGPESTRGGPSRMPEDVAELLVPPILSDPGDFLQWDYGCGIIIESLWRFADTFGMEGHVPQLNTLLDGFLTDPNKNGYKILHGVRIPFGSAVGDTVGLFPIAYLARVAFYLAHFNPTYSNVTDLALINAVVTNYLLAWPTVLPDGTFARTYGIPGQPSGFYLWDDDQFMGLSLINQASAFRLFHDSGAKALRMADMLLSFRNHRMTSNLHGGVLFWHGVNAQNLAHSCCFWSRGNGWVLMTYVETLNALKQTGNEKAPVFGKLLSIFDSHATALVALQGEDGRFHQVINDTSTFLESSSCGMFIYSMVEAIKNGYVHQETYEEAIDLAWEGLTAAISDEGIVEGICEGTGIGPDVHYYAIRSTEYTKSSPGLGSVLRAVLAYQEFLNMKRSH